MLDPDPELDDDPDLLDAEELLPELLPEPLDELPDEELRDDLRCLVFCGDRPRDNFFLFRVGLELCDRAL